MEKANKRLNDFDARNPGTSSRATELKLWNKTAGYRTRDPLFLIPKRALAVDGPGFNSYFFFNMSNTLPIKPSMVLSSEAVNMLRDFVDQIPLSDEQTAGFGDFLKILPFIDKMTIQERRIGGMFQFNVVDGRWVLQLETLLMLGERNFWVKNKAERKTLMDILGDGTGKAVKMRFGIGDTRLRLGYKVAQSKWVDAVLGLQATIPTSRIGRKKPQSVKKVGAGATRAQLLENLMNMNRFLMIEPKLGTGHWGIGCFLDTRIHLVPDTLDFWSRVSFDYLLPGNEYRFMPSSCPISLKDLQNLMASETVPDNFPINAVFPCLAKAKVYPGHIFNATVGFDWKFAKNWNLGIGYDFYAQQAERIKNVSVPDIDASLIRVEDAIASKVMQHKVFGELSYTKKGKSMDWNFGFGGDVTFSSQGASRDWTLYTKIGIAF